ncbi:hypothetical protein EDC14_10297 [Hydrogenispora ethanolica]|uniref:Uncharacterized protein n=1 Tax=Hydrogenispora ethanolica TaxID=1082276 RepID=A0A4R1R8N4_HYDET|nr:hypothetical protein [Hydrogenispora ethanolica]TCL61978.1 hypothetical protein EDC14_10297 [Hydrogenispora ethanolica]
MLIVTDRTLALRCPLCGRLEFHPISLFDFSGHSSMRLRCKCGFEKAILYTKNSKGYFLQLPCLICEEVHIHHFTKQELWADPLLILRCTETDQEVGYLGMDGEVESMVRRKRNDPDSIFNNVGFDDYFVNPQVMFETLNCLHQLAEANKLTCRCGNDRIEIAVFPDKLELRCPVCQSQHTIPAETIDDLKLVKQAQPIVLNEKGFSGLDSSKVHPL